MGISKWIKGLGKNTLYYPGCLTKFVLEQEKENYKKILLSLGIDFIMISEELCCGMPVINAGYEKDARNLARKNYEILKKYSVNKIITNCPSCYSMFKDYKNLLPYWDIEVEHITITIRNKLKYSKIKQASSEEVAYHDPCHLSRNSGISEEPREILKMIGYKIKEMKNNRENSLCCGGGAGLKVNESEIAEKIARKRIGHAIDLGMKKLITPCPLCFAHMKNSGKANAFPDSPKPRKVEGFGDKGIEVLEFSYVIGRALGLEVENVNEEILR